MDRYVQSFVYGAQNLVICEMCKQPRNMKDNRPLEIWSNRTDSQQYAQRQTRICSDCMTKPVLNNHGLSLLEMMVCLVILGIIIQVQCVLFSQSNKQYTRLKKEIELARVVQLSCTNTCSSPRPSVTPSPSPSKCPEGHHEGDSDEDKDHNHH
jgi:prepilin-type N-terminal cleavage/methylation domain-containing protein